MRDALSLGLRASWVGVTIDGLLVLFADDFEAGTLAAWSFVAP